MKILFLESDKDEEYNCSNWRCIMPARALQRAGIPCQVVKLENWVKPTPEIDALTSEADLIFLQRNLFLDVIPLVMRWRAEGKIIITDVDDAYEHMTASTGCPSYELWINNRVEVEQNGVKKLTVVSPGPLDLLRGGVKLCGNLCSPSKVLCDDWKQYARTYWFPNFADPDLYVPNPGAYHEPGILYLGWGGSMTHLASWNESGLVKAIETLFQERKNLKLMLMGDPRVRKFINVSNARKVSAGWHSHIIFARKLAQVDIGLIPLHGEYDRRRSWIKSLEYTLMEIPWVGTDMEPNHDIQTGTLVNNTIQGWHDALSDLVDHMEERRQVIKEQAAIMRKSLTTDGNIDFYINLFNRIMEDNQ